MLPRRSLRAALVLGAALVASVAHAEVTNRIVATTRRLPANVTDDAKSAAGTVTP